MALMECELCKMQVSESESNCPRCGSKFKTDDESIDSFSEHEGMFSNIGSKIKTTAKVIAWIGIIISIIIGFMLSSQGCDNDEGIVIFTGISIMVGGSILSWVSSFFMYGFGELIERATEIAINTSKDKTLGTLTSKMVNEEKLKGLLEWKNSGLISDEEFEVKKQELLSGE